MAHKPLDTYLRTFRKLSGFSQKDIAFLLSCRNGSKISRYEHGRRLPNLLAALGYAVIFRVPLQQLFAGIFRRVEKRIAKRAGFLFRKTKTFHLDTQTAEKLMLLEELSGTKKK